MNELKTKSIFILTLLVWSALGFRQRAWGDGAAASAQFFNPEAVAVDSVGNVLVADSHNHTIRKLTPLGTNWVSSTIAGVPGVVSSADGANSAALFYSPFGITVDSRGDVYVADTGNHTIRKLTATGTNWISTTIAGMAGSVYVADPCGVTIRKLTPPLRRGRGTRLLFTRGFPLRMGLSFWPGIHLTRPRGRLQPL